MDVSLYRAAALGKALDLKRRLERRGVDATATLLREIAGEP